MLPWLGADDWGAGWRAPWFGCIARRRRVRLLRGCTAAAAAGGTRNVYPGYLISVNIPYAVAGRARADRDESRPPAGERGDSTPRSPAKSIKIKRTLPKIMQKSCDGKNRGANETRLIKRKFEINPGNSRKLNWRPDFSDGVPNARETGNGEARQVTSASVARRRRQPSPRRRSRPRATAPLWAMHTRCTESAQCTERERARCVQCTLCVALATAPSSARCGASAGTRRGRRRTRRRWVATGRAGSSASTRRSCDSSK